MKNIIYGLALFLFCGCIDQIKIDTPEVDSVMVIDGVFTDIEEMQTIKVSESIALNSQVPVPVAGAQIFVEDEDGGRIAFSEGATGTYQAMAKSQAEKRYRLFGILPDGREITSNFQAVPNSFPIDDISIVDTTVTFTDESGDRRRLKTIDFYANGAANQVAEDLYLRFSYETVYQIGEIVCGPFDIADVCYIYNDERPLEIHLVEINQTEEQVAFKSLAYRRRIDEAFGEVFALDLRLYSYNKSEYEYWERLKLIFDQTGNITDVTPARLAGNVKANDGSEIQGQFAVVGKSRQIEIVRNSDFSIQQLPTCGIPGQRPFPLPVECCGCLVLPFSTSERPDYWP